MDKQKRLLGDRKPFETTDSIVPYRVKQTLDRPTHQPNLSDQPAMNSLLDAAGDASTDLAVGVMDPAYFVPKRELLEFQSSRIAVTGCTRCREETHQSSLLISGCSRANSLLSSSYQWESSQEDVGSGGWTGEKRFLPPPIEQDTKRYSCVILRC